MITANNYHTATQGLDFTSAPDAIQNMHSKFDLMNKYYQKNDGITDAINVYLDKLNAWHQSGVREMFKNATKKPEAAKKIKEPKKIAAPKVVQAKAKAKANPKPKFKAGDLVKVRLKGWVMVIDKVEEYNKQSKGYRYFVENTTKGTGNGNVGSYWAHELKLYTKKVLKPKKAATKKPTIAKAVKTAKVKSPELALIQSFIGLNKKFVSVKSLHAKIDACKHLETIKHKPIIDEIKSKLAKGIEAAKNDSNNNGTIKPTIDPKFIELCKATIKNATELLRVSYLGAAKAKAFVRKPSRVDDLLLLDEIKGRAKAAKKKAKSVRKA